MDIDPDEIVTVELDTYDWERSYSRLLTRRQLGELLLHFDDMADQTEATYEEGAQHNQRAELVAAGRCPNCRWPDYQCNCAEHPDA
ncbi:hypothetical protein [Streptomyces platensis]|uniref:hypothetical protein n=1 Tax=Streptomyces platensis TaxID=58346 RepID=UPI002E275BF6